jgi:N-methylhydantoinase A
MIIHGTTLATNSLIQRNGAKTALITTEGFRDVIEMRTENRFEQYDINLALPPPLISRQHRYTVNERIWTPPRLQAICFLTIKYDCIRISDL